MHYTIPDLIKASHLPPDEALPLIQEEVSSGHLGQHPLLLNPVFTADELSRWWTYRGESSVALFKRPPTDLIAEMARSSVSALVLSRNGITSRDEVMSALKAEVQAGRLTSAPGTDCLSFAPAVLEAWRKKNPMFASRYFSKSIDFESLV